VRVGVTVALALAVAATVWFLATKKHATQDLARQHPETVRARATVTPLERPVAAPQEPDESIPSRERSPQEHAAAVKHALTLTMGPDRDRIAERLVAQGLSQPDAERMGQHAIEGYADCLYEAARKQYAAQGNLNEFLDHIEIAWVFAASNLNRVRATMAPCLANIGQQTGIPWPAEYASGGSPDERITLPPPPPPWAAEMDSRIRDHVASHPGLGVTDVFVECRDEGCGAMLVGRDIRIFDFDVFAGQNGFRKAVVAGDSNRRSVWLER
jgi:hypothetical protein